MVILGLVQLEQIEKGNDEVKNNQLPTTNAKHFMQHKVYYYEDKLFDTYNITQQETEKSYKYEKLISSAHAFNYIVLWVNHDLTQL